MATTDPLTNPTPAPAREPRTQEQIITRPGIRKALAVSRFVIGFTFLWAFLDKLFGLSFSTPPEGAWLRGGSPAQGYIGGIEGPFAGFFQIFANPFGDWLFMVGLLGIGVAMIAGAGLRVAAVAGTVLLLFMFLADLPAATAVVDGELVRGSTNPLVDSHWHEALLLIIPALTLAGDTWGLGRWWSRTIGSHRWLR